MRIPNQQKVNGPPLYETMKITLELWDDQCTITDDANSSLWVMKLNGQQFPSGENSLMTLDVAHKIVNKLLDIETIAYNEHAEP